MEEERRRAAREEGATEHMEAAREEERRRAAREGPTEEMEAATEEERRRAAREEGATEMEGRAQAAKTGTSVCSSDVKPQAERRRPSAADRATQAAMTTPCERGRFACATHNYTT